MIIVGDADEKNLLYKNKLVDLSSNNPNIHWVGWQNNRGVYEHLVASDLAVFPASQSIVWQQALAAHLPLIVGDVGEQSLHYLNEFKAIIELEKNEITVENIKNAIFETITDENLAEGKLRAAKTSAKYLDWNHLINKTLSHVKDPL